MKTTLIAAAFAGLLATPVLAESQFELVDPYAISAGAAAKAGAAFFTIRNTGDTDDVLIGIESDVAPMVQLHTHIMEDGIAKMRQIEGGIAIPAGGEHILERGADHVMFMGLKGGFTDGEIIHATLHFESGASLEVEIPVDQDHDTMPAMDHGAMDHNN